MRVNFASFRAQAFGARAVPRCAVRSQSTLQSNFLGSRLSLSQRQSVPGFVNVRPTPLPSRRIVTVEANGKRSLGCTLHGTRRARTRTSGFRARKLTVGGRKVLKARASRGRKQLCPANSNTGVKSTAASNKKSTNKAYRVNRDNQRFYDKARGYSKLPKGQKF